MDLVNSGILFVAIDEDVGLEAFEAGSAITNESPALLRVTGNGQVESW